MHVESWLVLIPHAIGVAERVVGWLATYAIHSTLLILAAVVLTSRRVPWSLSTAAHEVIWKGAIVGGLVTATLQVAAAASPIGGTWNVRSATERRTLLMAISHNGDEHSMFEVTEGEVGVAGEARTAVRPIRLDGPGFTVRTAVTPVSATVMTIGVLWLAIAAVLGWRYDRAGATLAGILCRRRWATDGFAATTLAALCRRAMVGQPVRLSVSDALATPAVVDRDEICVPSAFLGLNALQQEAILAHELAHIVRRDQRWLTIAYLMVQAFPFQPLNRLARTRLMDISEFGADAWAVKLTGRPLDLARGLATVATWLPGLANPLWLPAIASERGSALVQRVARLTQPASMTRPPRRSWSPLLVVAVLGLAVVTVPRVELAHPLNRSGQVIIAERVVTDGYGDLTRMRVVQLDSGTTSRIDGLERRVTVRLERGRDSLARPVAALIPRKRPAGA